MVYRLVKLGSVWYSKGFLEIDQAVIDDLCAFVENGEAVLLVDDLELAMDTLDIDRDDIVVV